MNFSKSLLVMALVAASACDVKVDVGDAGSTGGGTGGGSTNAGGGSGGGTAQGFGCSATKACPSGQFCFNGICAVGCQSNGDCAADQYCATDYDRLCHNKEVTTCPQVACEATQQCVNGLCSVPPPSTQCDPDQVINGSDGCDVNALCIDPADTKAKDPKCYSFPACSQNKTCPTGLYGAVCNDGLIPNKGLVCVTSLCTSVANCPANWLCFKNTQTDVVGTCSNRSTGSLCHTGADCLSGNCSVFGVGFPGFCT